MYRTTLMGLALAGLAWSAPLAPSDHWAAEALRRLAEKGLVQGYRDGDFKGDRAASRYEVALLLARLFREAHFADRDSLLLVRELAGQLREELDALGVRVAGVEVKLGRLDERVGELERITFYGGIESRALAQAFTNRGGASGVSLLDYNQVVGSSVGPTLRPQVQGILPVVDYRNGRALVNGAGFTAAARLGLKLKLDADNEAGVELGAYTAQGNQIIDAYWGASAPYLANPWTLNQTAGGRLQGQNNSPFSRVVFDHAWWEHKPSQTRVTLGYYDSLRMDPFIYAGQGGANNLFGPARFAGFGVQWWGQFDLGEDQDLKYELIGSRFGDGGNVFAGTNYTHAVFGGDLFYRNGRADLKFNWVRYYDESPEFSGPLVGLLSITNVAYLNSTGFTPVQWVNPPGHFARQGPAGFVPNLVDTRPIGGWNGNADNTLGITAGAGNFGPQSQNTYGLSAHYQFDGGVKLTGEFGHSDYKSNRNSRFVSSGNLGKVDLSAVCLEGRLNLSLAYLRVDPNYNPALFNASLLGIRFVRPWNHLGRFALYDNGNYPQNREGLLFKGNYRWDTSWLGWKANFLRQTRTSLYDVRVPGGALGSGTPTNDVIGFAPGFFDVIFPGLAHPNLYGPRSFSSFTAALEPLEDPRGTVSELGLYFKHQFEEPRLSLEVSLERNHYLRNSSLPAALGGSQNQIDLKTDYALLGLSWGLDQAWTLRGGMEVVRAYGHHDPGGLYNGFAVLSGQTNFSNIDSVQTIPYLGFDHQLSKNTSWGMDFRYYNTRDHAALADPFSWSGPQVSSYYKLTF